MRVMKNVGRLVLQLQRQELVLRRVYYFSGLRSVRYLSRAWTFGSDLRGGLRSARLAALS